MSSFHARCFSLKKEKKGVKWNLLTANNIGDEEAKKISEALRKNDSLTELFLMSNEQNQYGERSNTDLKWKENVIEDKGAEALTEALENNSSLTRLNMSGEVYANSMKDD